jgi:UDP-N-acetylmuramate--alanine ligase
MFTEAALDPTVVVGAVVPAWSSNLRIGKSDLFVAEACEYRRHMLRLTPQTIVLTNIELDHPDYYHDLEDVMDAFREYVGKLGDEGLLVYNRDNANTRKITEGSNAIHVSYGIGEGPDLYARDIVEEGGKSHFALVWKGASLGQFTTELPGLYNLYNILAATATLLAYGGHGEHVAQTLAQFHGVGRRFEVVGMYHATTVVSDYAHHPTALREVLHAAASRFIGKRMLTIFQPHQRERTLKLWKEFVGVLAEIENAVLVEPYAVPGREDGMESCGKRLVEEVETANPRGDFVYAPDLNEAEHIVRELAGEYEVILVVGAGDIDGVARRLVEKTFPVELEPSILQTAV